MLYKYSDILVFNRNCIYSFNDIYEIIMKVVEFKTSY